MRQIVGAAVDAKEGAAVDTGDDLVFVQGKDAWPRSVLRRRVRVRGRLSRVGDRPVFVVKPGEPVRSGIPAADASAAERLRWRTVITPDQLEILADEPAVASPAFPVATGTEPAGPSGEAGETGETGETGESPDESAGEAGEEDAGEGQTGAGDPGTDIKTEVDVKTEETEPKEEEGFFRPLASDSSLPFREEDLVRVKAEVLPQINLDFGSNDLKRVMPWLASDNFDLNKQQVERLQDRNMLPKFKVPPLGWVEQVRNNGAVARWLGVDRILLLKRDRDEKIRIFVIEAP